MDDAALSVCEVSRRFRGILSVDRVDLTVAKGEVVALVGLNGAGKTTLLRLVLGMLRADEGEIGLDGRSLHDLPSAAWMHVGHFVDQAPGYPELTARRNLAAAARLKGVREPDRLAASTLRSFALEPYADRRLRHLSLGNRQRVGLGAALQHDPALVILDEPGNALDPSGVLLLRERLKLLADRGAGVLVSSHHLDEVARVADRIVVMNRGRVVDHLAPSAPELELEFFEIVRRDDEVRAGASVRP